MTKKPDIVYILGTGSKWFNNEIRYSLRSLENLENKGRVFIVGYLPRFVDTYRVHYIDAVDPGKNKLLNAMHKIRIACKHGEISDDFILMNDDFIFNKKVKSIFNFNMGTLKQAEKEHKTKAGYYYRAIKETIDELSKLGVKNPVNHELHYPMIINKKKFLDIIDPYYYRQHPILFRSIYGNLAQIRSGKRKDQKIYSIDELKEMKEWDFISTDNKVCLEYKLQDWLIKRFPDKCKYER